MCSQIPQLICLWHWGKIKTSLFVHIVQISTTLLDTLGHRYLRFADPFAGIVITFVGFLWPIWIADLSLQVTLLGLVKIQKPLPVSPLCVSVNVHLHHSVAQRKGYVRFFRA